MAFHPGYGIILAIEVKTDLASAEATLRKLDEKVRLAATVARKRFGWRAKAISRLLVLPESATLRRRVSRHAQVFDQALPAHNVAIRHWVQRPDGPLSGLWFFSDRDAGGCIPGARRRERVRCPKSLSTNPHIAA